MPRNRHELVWSRKRKRNGNYVAHGRCKCGQWNFTPNEQVSPHAEEDRMWKESGLHEASHGQFR